MIKTVSILLITFALLSSLSCSLAQCNILKCLAHSLDNGGDYVKCPMCVCSDGNSDFLVFESHDDL
jgi:hypothetical protein